MRAGLSRIPLEFNDTSHQARHMDITDIVQAGASFVSVIVAGAALYVAFRSTRGTEASAEVAKELARIEAQREHRALFPQVEISCARNEGEPQWKLVAKLVGPDPLDHLDAFSVTIRDDGRDRSPQHPGSGLSQDEIDQQIWGPYMLKPHGGAADGLGRSSVPVPINVGDEVRWHLQQTVPPRWFGGGLPGWQNDYRGQPIRLELRCERAGYEPWLIRRQLPQPE